MSPRTPSVRQTLFRVLAGFNAASVSAMMLSGYSGWVSSEQHPFFSILGLIFPLFLLINIAWLAFWVFFRLRYTLISFVGCILCFAPIRAYTPLNIGKEVPENTIKVLSFNVFWFAPWNQEKPKPNLIVEYLKNSGADIVCLQESSPGELGYDYLLEELQEAYPYHHFTGQHSESDAMTLFSKFPIIDTDRIEYSSVGNMSMAYRLLIDGDTVLVVNNHLETNGFSKEDKESFKSMIQGDLKDEKPTDVSRSLANKLMDAARKRAPQADAVARYIAESKTKHIIVCGDFNDTPLSYAHRTIAKRLTDCYIATANGPGFSYHENSIHVRIDNIFCSDSFTPYACEVDKSIKTSDHYPIHCRLKFHKDS
ncbi:MAG: endonuclease/exonuclease/phosphatase family protein [Prevotella sp.]|nr:endonuclease/exonuclease/phosphatase family protein [Prevotella sp.]MDY2633268.1 endonuclease/exonuclease/phosphatase family protein [Prevotella sp.]